MRMPVWLDKSLIKRNVSLYTKSLNRLVVSREAWINKNWDELLTLSYLDIEVRFASMAQSVQTIYDCGSPYPKYIAMDPTWDKNLMDHISDNLSHRLYRCDNGHKTLSLLLEKYCSVQSVQSKKRKVKTVPAIIHIPEHPDIRHTNFKPYYALVSCLNGNLDFVGGGKLYVTRSTHKLNPDIAYVTPLLRGISLDYIAGVMTSVMERRGHEKVAVLPSNEFMSTMITKFLERNDAQ